jgi:polysaccharide biosynthesis transport protein
MAGSNNQDQESKSPFAPTALWRAIRKNWILAATVAGIIVSAVTFYTLGEKRIYLASGTVQFDPQPPRPLGTDVQAVVDMGAGAFWNNQEYYTTQYQIIQSMQVALRVVRSLALHRDAGFINNNPPGTPPATADVSEEHAAKVLLSRIDVEPVKKSRIAEIRYRDADPDRAQRILRTLMETYVQQNLDFVLDSTNQAGEWLRTQLGKLKTDLESSEMSLHNYKLDKNILSVSIDDQSNMLRGEMEKLNDELTRVRTKRVEVESREAELRKIDGSNPVNLPASELLNSGVLSNLRQQYVDALKVRDALLGEGKAENHPEVKATEAKVVVTRKALTDEVTNIQQAVKHDLAAVTTQVASLSNLLESAKKRALQLNLLEIEYNRLNRNKQNVEKLYGVVLDRTKESDLTKLLRVNNIRVLDPPLRPSGPVSPRVPLNIALGALAGIALGLIVAIGREQLDRTVKSPDDVEEQGATFLGLLPEVESKGGIPKRHRRREAAAAAKGRPELIVHTAPSSGIAEAARAIRTNLAFMSPDQPYRVLLVTSAGPMEGKTTVASCLGVAMAQAGQRVLLMDCDLRRPRVHKIFQKPNTKGVTSALIDSAQDAFYETEVPNLWVMPSGPVPPNPAELLHSAAFERLLATLGKKFDRVVIDSPPVMPVTDAAVIAPRVDGTLLVIRAFQTSKDATRQALRTLRDVGGRTVGAVLNAVDLQSRQYGYYYRYYYYRSSGYASNEAEAAE